MYKDLTGQIFGKLTVIRRNGKDSRRNAIWECQCECGNIINVRSNSLLTGHTSTCGCTRKDNLLKANYKHGDGVHRKRSRLYSIWSAMKSRCENEKSESYKWYGAKGVRVCDSWQDYKIFKEWALANGYDEKAKQWECTIDRINPYGNYEPNNCRWVSMKVQNNNKRVKESEE